MSIAAKAFTRYLFTSANRFASKEAVLASADTNSDGVTPPPRLFRNCNITSERIDGRLVITVSPKTGGSGKQLFYIHGGGYVHGIIKPHWWLIADLIKRTGATVTVPIYRLIQDGGTASSEVPWLIDIYESLAEQGPVYVAGDSAGCGSRSHTCTARGALGGPGLGRLSAIKLNLASLPDGARDRVNA